MRKEAIIIGKALAQGTAYLLFPRYKEFVDLCVNTLEKLTELHYVEKKQLNAYQNECAKIEDSIPEDDIAISGLVYHLNRKLTDTEYSDFYGKVNELADLLGDTATALSQIEFTRNSDRMDIDFSEEISCPEGIKLAVIINQYLQKITDGVYIKEVVPFEE